MSAPVHLFYEVAPDPKRWVLLEDEPMPETPLSDAINELFELLLKAHVLRQRRSAMVGRHIAVRWDAAHPRVGVDPDVYLVEPAPPEGEDARSLLLWKKGHHAPQLVLEVVSEGHARKDYLDAPEKYAACGTYELVVFDPLLIGRGLRGGPHLLQLWRRDARGRFRRVHAGRGPVFSRWLRAWLIVTDSGRRLRISEDAGGRRPWLTEAEQSHQEVKRLEALLRAKRSPRKSTRTRR